jgi:cleavage stimulation factor subunit 3
MSLTTLQASVWRAYLQWEEENDRMNAMVGIFDKSLLKVLNVELWLMYINYVRRRYSLQSGDFQANYKIINDVFQFALKTIGIDKDAGKVWQDYIVFLKSGPGTLGGGQWQDGAKADQIRAAYQRAIAVPTEAVTQLWRDYDGFETGLSKINGRKHLQEMSATYMTARQAYVQLGNITAGLQRTTQPRLLPLLGYQGEDEFQRQIGIWLAWIQWEKEDPLVLKEDDANAYRQRVVYAYKQATMALQFWPDIWYSAAEFCFENAAGSDETLKEAMNFLERGVAANPESPLLAFKLADRLEGTTQNDETSDPGAKDRMRKVRQPLDKVVEALYELHKKVSDREQNEVKRLEHDSQTSQEGVDDEVNAANVASKKAELDYQIGEVRKAAKEELDVLTKLISHVWIAIARVTRRIQGKGDAQNGFRGVFNEARKKGKLTSIFYVECAAIEWQCYQDKTSTRLLERGMKLFPEDDYLPLEYIKHLFAINDVTNARGVFETSVTRLINADRKDKTKALFRYLHVYESRFGELAQVQRLEQRMRELFPEDPQLELFGDRYSSERFDPILAIPVISRKQQMIPKTETLIPSIEAENVSGSPIQPAINLLTATSPKRALPDDFEDGGVRKVARGESPLKGAAGRRMHQQRQANGSSVSSVSAPLPAPLPPAIHYLLSILPKAQFYTETRLDAAKLINLIRDVHLPPPGALPTHPTPQPQPPPQPAWPHQSQPQHFGHLPQPPMPTPGFVHAPVPGPGQYGGGKSSHRIYTYAQY